MIRTLENRFYYLDNFHRVTEWIDERYRDLLGAEELAFITHFSTLPQPSRALLVRMVMRKGTLFRASKLRYEEIGSTNDAARPLVEAGWVDDRPLLSLHEVFGLLTMPEIASCFRDALPANVTRKADRLEALAAVFTEPRTFDAWHPDSDDRIYALRVHALCDRLRLMFFGNLHQDWTEFVLSDLGIYRYETVEFSPSSRGFRNRADVDTYLHLYQCRERFESGEAAEDVLGDIPGEALENDWLEGRRAKLLFALGQHFERTENLPAALDIYLRCSFPGARARAIRVMEKSGQTDTAYALAQTAAAAPEDETERQQLSRILPRLHRKLGLPKAAARPALPVSAITLTLPAPDGTHSVEQLAALHLMQEDAPVFYVENTLITSLFGLLCWPAIFKPVPGAFFHPFHIGPADLHSIDFSRKREEEFAACLAQLDTGQYIDTINRHFNEKMGIQSPFVAWSVLTEELKDTALACIPASHLKKWCERILLDIKSNRAGFPDLIQFWPHEKRYRMIEVKGPGDRLQDNQIRLLEYCIEHGMPVDVCYVQWAEDTA
ncbi:MAG TPA: VRR-NUC domain-containing protein [Noviherbaspirillum sp.]